MMPQSIMGPFQCRPAHVCTQPVRLQSCPEGWTRSFSRQHKNVSSYKMLCQISLLLSLYQLNGNYTGVWYFIQNLKLWLSQSNPKGNVMQWSQGVTCHVGSSLAFVTCGSRLVYYGRGWVSLQNESSLTNIVTLFTVPAPQWAPGCLNLGMWSQGKEQVNSQYYPGLGGGNDRYAAMLPRSPYILATVFKFLRPDDLLGTDNSSDNLAVPREALGAAPDYSRCRTVVGSCVRTCSCHSD